MSQEKYVIDGYSSLKNLQQFPIPLRAKFNLFTMIWPSLILWSHLLPFSPSFTLFQEQLYSLPNTVLPPGLCICFSSCLDHSSLRCPHGSQLLFIYVPVFLNSETFLDHPLQNTPSFSSPCALTWLYFSSWHLAPDIICLFIICLSPSHSSTYQTECKLVWARVYLLCFYCSS